MAKESKGKATAEAPLAAKWPAVKTELWNLARIKPYDKNARTHPPEQISLLAALMKKRGVDQPIVVDEAGVIIKGHGRLAAAREAGFKQFPVAVHRGLSEADKRAMRIEDNQLSLLSGWDDQLLRLELAELKLGGYELPLLGFDGAEIDRILAWGDPLDAMPVLADGDRTPFQQITFTLHDEQVAVVSEAVKLARSMGPFTGSPNENGNGNGLARVCEQWLKAQARKGKAA